MTRGRKKRPTKRRSAPPKARVRRPTARPHSTLVWQLAAITLGFVVAVNVLVRALGGGTPNPLSPLHLVDKSRALFALGLHGAQHVLGNPHLDDRGAVSAAALHNGVPVALALAVARSESHFDPHAISHTGAMGLMQLMPGTAADLGVGDAFDSNANAEGATRYLRSLLTRYRGDERRALAAYNAGPARVAASGEASLPDETRHYVRTVLSRRDTGSGVPTRLRGL